MNLTATSREKFFAALQAAGMPDVPREFSVVPQHQLIGSATLAEIVNFIGVFDQVTAREAWQAAVQREAPAIAQQKRLEVCFFSAWDFHLPPEGGCRLIEFNDNGSGFLFAAIINDLYYTAAGLGQQQSIAPPAELSAFNQRLGELVEQEARTVFENGTDALFLVLDDAESVQRGKFRAELRLLCDLFRRRGWRAEVGGPPETRWDGRQLLFDGQPVSFVVNRSTDFFWQSEDFSPLRRAYDEGHVYVAPNPFTYATRSDKRLLEWLSLSHWDEDLGIQFAERQVLSALMPETHVVRAENLEALAQRRQDLVFKPLHGFAGRGLIASETVGRARLRRLVKHGEGYVAQKWISKSCMDVEGQPLWTDLRVWAYRGKILLLSGRASRRVDRLDLTPPGGWLPTYVSL